MNDLSKVTSSEACRIREEERNQDSVNENQTPMAHDSGSSSQGVECYRWHVRGMAMPIRTAVHDSLLGDKYTWGNSVGDVKNSELFDTEKEAIDAAKIHAKNMEAFWYARIRALDARMDEIEIQEMKESDNEATARR